MAIPYRGMTGKGTYFITSATYQKISIFQTNRMARAKKELGFGGEVWEHSFHDRRVRDEVEYERFREYIHQNPVKRRLAVAAGDYPYSSAAGVFSLDEVPQRLKAVSGGLIMQR